MTRGAKQGENTSTVISTPARQKRTRTARQREEDRWAARAGPITITRILAEGEEQRTPQPHPATLPR